MTIKAQTDSSQSNTERAGRDLVRALLIAKFTDEDIQALEQECLNAQQAASDPAIWAEAAAVLADELTMRAR